MQSGLGIEQIRSLLSPGSLNLPAGVEVERIDVDPYMDSDGEDSLFVLIVLKDGTEIPLPGDWSLETRQRILQTLISNDCQLWPYTHYALESELLEVEVIEE